MMTWFTWFFIYYLTICTTEAAYLHYYACPLIFWLNDKQAI